MQIKLNATNQNAIRNKFQSFVKDLDNPMPCNIVLAKHIVEIDERMNNCEHRAIDVEDSILTVREMLRILLQEYAYQLRNSPNNYYYQRYMTRLRGSLGIRTVNHREARFENNDDYIPHFKTFV